MTMNLIPTELHGVIHPLIESAFVKKIYLHGKEEQVLVAQTNISSYAAATGEAEDDMWSLMSEMPALKRKAAEITGPIDYLEIRYAH